MKHHWKNRGRSSGQQTDDEKIRREKCSPFAATSQARNKADN